MRRLTISIVLPLAFMAGCAARTTNKPMPTVGTLAELRKVQPDVQEVRVEQGLDQAMTHYRRFLEETPETTMTPEAMRRLADLQLEKQFGIRTGDAKPREMAAPRPAQTLAGAQANKTNPAAAVAGAAPAESDQEFERRTTAEGQTAASGDAGSPAGVSAGAAP